MYDTSKLQLPMTIIFPKALIDLLTRLTALGGLVSFSFAENSGSAWIEVSSSGKPYIYIRTRADGDGVYCALVAWRRDES